MLAYRRHHYGWKGPRGQAALTSDFHVGKLRSREEEGCAEGVSLEWRCEPRCPTSCSGSWLLQLTVSETWSVCCPVGTETGDCRKWQRRRPDAADRRGHWRVLLEAKELVTLGRGSPVLHPERAVLWLVGTGELGWGPGTQTVPQLLPRRICTLPSSPVDVNGPPTSAFAQHGPEHQARCLERHRGPGFRVLKCDEGD